MIAFFYFHIDSDGAESYYWIHFPRTCRQSVERSGILGLCSDYVCVSINARQRCDSSTGFWVWICNSHHNGGQYDDQICTSCFWIEIGHTMGEQSCVPSLHWTCNRTHSRYSLHHFRVFDGENLHSAAICIQTDVLYNQVSFDLRSWKVLELKTLCFYRNFKKALNDVILSRRAIHNMNTLYPDATPEELAMSDNICIICREDMVNSSKKLPCGHIFHTLCLRWVLENSINTNWNLI